MQEISFEFKASRIKEAGEGAGYLPPLRNYIYTYKNKGFCVCLLGFVYLRILYVFIYTFLM